MHAASTDRCSRKQQPDQRGLAPDCGHGSARGGPYQLHDQLRAGLDPVWWTQGSGGLCRLSDPVFVFRRRDHSDGGVASAPVVDLLDPVADGELSRGLGWPQVAVMELDLSNDRNLWMSLDEVA